MTSISTLNSSQTVSTLAPAGKATTAASDANASQDRFLKLLVAQLNNQDPMNPMDNAQMTSQMAQINTVTGIQQVNETLKSMAEQFSGMQVLQGSNMVGHDVLLESNTLSIRDGVAGGAIDLAAKAESVKVDILSPGGNVIDTINLGALGAGRSNFDWDASKYSFNGDPTFKVSATLGGKDIDNTALSRARVMSVGSDAGVMNVQLQGRSPVAYSAVKAIL
jgi:flagellar basal-body rod modification protein FlgD